MAMRKVKELFELGQIVIVEDVQEIIEDGNLALQNILGKCLHQYSFGKWGKTDPQRAWKNEMNVKKGDGRISAMYETPYGNIEITTNWKRETTEIRFAE